MVDHQSLTESQRKLLKKQSIKEEILQEKSANNWRTKVCLDLHNSVEVYVKKMMETFEMKKLPFVSNNQRVARLVFARKYRKFTTDEWENFSLALSARNTLFIFPTIKTISYGAHRRVKFRHRTKLKEA